MIPVTTLLEHLTGQEEAPGTGLHMKVRGPGALNLALKVKDGCVGGALCWVWAP